MIEYGIIKRVDKDLAWVTITRGAQCAGCSACQAFGDGTFELLAFNKSGSKPGDKVEVEIDPKVVVHSSLIVFLLPVLGLIIGYFLGVKFLAPFQFSDEGAGILGSICLMILTFIGIKIYDRIISRNHKINARITRIL